MPLGFSALSEYAISEIPGGSSPSGGGAGTIDAAYSLLLDLDVQEELLWDLDIDCTLLLNLDIAAYVGDMIMTTPIDIGDTATLSSSARTSTGGLILSSEIILQIKTPDGVQWPDVPGTDLTYNPSTERYTYRYYITGDYAQVGTHYFRFRVLTTDSEGPVKAADWQPIIVRPMPFSET
jgi:hypothetical protein